MKVILLKDVPKVGQKNTIREIPDGYARNFLLKQKLALPATPEHIAALNRELAIKNEARQKELDRVGGHFKKAADEALTLTLPTNEQGHLFQSVNVKTIVKALKEKRDVEIPENAIQLDEPIKQTGAYEIVLEWNGKKQTLHLLIEKGK